MLQTSPKMLHNKPPQAPPDRISQLRSVALNYLPSTVNTTRGMVSRTGQVLDFNGPPVINKDTFKDILADPEDPTTAQRQVQFANMATSKSVPLKKTVCFHLEWTLIQAPHRHLIQWMAH